MKNTISTLIILTIFFHTGIAQTSDKVLKVGDPAPPLQVAAWLQGDCISEFKEDEVYVVELTGSWCPSCRRAIPHLTKLQKKYKDMVQFVSVYHENNNSNDTTDLRYIQRVSELIEEMGNRMNFTVAVDVPQQTTRKIWGAFSAKGIGHVMVIVSGKIAWGGSRLFLGEALEVVATGTFDFSKVTQREEDFNGQLRQAWQNERDGNYQIGVAIINRLLNKYPEYWARLYYFKFQMLALGNDPGEAYRLLQELLDRNIEAFDWLHFLSSKFRLIKPEERDYALELKAFDYAIETEIRKYGILLKVRKAEIYAEMGNFRKAKETIEEAILDYDKFWAADPRYKRNNPTYHEPLATYTYRLLADEDIREANTWLRTNLQNVPISRYLLEAVVETNTKSPSFEAFSLTHVLIDRAISFEKSSFVLPYLWDLKAKVYMLAGEYELAHEWIDRAIQKSSATSYLARKALIYETSGELDKAVNLYQKAIALEKSKATAVENSGDYYLENATKYEKLLMEIKTKIKN